jgi:hypothetical protein
MSLGDLHGVTRPRRKYHGRALIQRFFHRRSYRLEQICLAIESRAVGQGLDRHGAMRDHAETHAIARALAGQRRDTGRRCLGVPLSVDGGCDRIQDRAKDGLGVSRHRSRRGSRQFGGHFTHCCGGKQVSHL